MRCKLLIPDEMGQRRITMKAPTKRNENCGGSVDSHTVNIIYMKEKWHLLVLNQIRKKFPVLPYKIKSYL